MKNYLLLLLSIFVFSCQKQKTEPVVTSSDTLTTEQNTEAKPVNIEEENKQEGDTIFMNFKNEAGKFIAEGSLDSIHPRVYVKFKNDAAAELNGKIVPTPGKGNIRFNQIIAPDQSSDGPFGMDIKTDLKQKGNYILVIGHSQMADNPYFGSFGVELETSKK